MTNLLAIDSATDALSLALLKNGELTALHRVMPRQHQQQLFACLAELLRGVPVAAAGLDAIVFGRGPGSFTGLRIAASAAQGLAFSLSLPVVALSSLETQGRTLLRREGIDSPCLLVSTIDARIGQIYVAVYHFDGSGVTELLAPQIVAAESWTMPAAAAGLEHLPLHLVGSGASFLAEAPPAGFSEVHGWPEVLPEARDMLRPAIDVIAAGGATAAADAIPDYVQPRIGWKTLAEQGRRA